MDEVAAKGVQQSGKVPAAPGLELRWLLTTRILLLIVSLISACVSVIINGATSFNRVGFIFGPIAVLLGISAASSLWIRKRKASLAFTYVQLIVDVLLITGIIYITGGPISPFLFLYLPLVMASSILLSRRTALILAGLSGLAYSMLSVALIQGWVPPANGTIFVEAPSGGFFLQVIGLCSGMVLVAVLTSYLTRVIQSSHQVAEQSKRDLVVLSGKQKELEEQLAVQEKMARLLAEPNTSDGKGRTNIGDFIGESQVMQKIFSLIERVSNSDATVLIGGESGTGKELVARAIHGGSSRSAKPFIAVNCGAIPENLIESELFGHKRGSFTGADSDYAGLFRQAEGGSIFLDEIGELPLSMQAKLLRALQEKTVRPIGGDRDIPINVRIIAASNRHLKKEVEVGNFREDLFYRLNVISIKLPPLRGRKEDIPLLTKTILRRLVDKDTLPVIPPATMQLLMNYHYPGNVRELENILERALVLSGEVILPEHLPDFVIAAKAMHPDSFKPETRIIVDESITFPIELDALLANIERRYIETALVKTNGAKKKAAELLGMNLRSFRYRLQKYDMADSEE